MVSDCPTYDLAHTSEILRKKNHLNVPLFCGKRINEHYRTLVTAVIKKAPRNQDKKQNSDKCDNRKIYTGNKRILCLSEVINKMVSLPSSNHFDSVIKTVIGLKQTNGLKTNRGCVESLKFCVGFARQEFFKIQKFLSSSRPKEYLKQAFPEYKELHHIFLIARKELLSRRPQGKPKLIRKKSDVTEHQINKNLSKISEDILASTFDGNIRVWVENERGWKEYTKLCREWDFADWIRTNKPIDIIQEELFAKCKGKKLKDLGFLTYNYFKDWLHEVLGLRWKTYKKQKYLCQNLPQPVKHKEPEKVIDEPAVTLTPYHRKLIEEQREEREYFKKLGITIY